MRYIFIASLIFSSCSFTVQPADLPPSFYGIDTAAEIVPGKTAFLGVELELLQSQDVFSLDVQPGVLIRRVGEESPADIAGLQPSDILLSYDGHPTDDPQRVTALLAGELQNRSVELEIQRGPEVLIAVVDLQMKSNNKLRTKYFVERGLIRAAFSDNLQAKPVIAALDNQSPLRVAGGKIGDKVISYQNDNPGSAAELVRRIRLGLAPGAHVDMLVERQDGTQHLLSMNAWKPERFVTEVGLWPLFYWQSTPGADKGVFTCGNLVLVDLFSYKRDGNESVYSVLGLLEWKTGELILEEE
ncbi:MAG: PDZ domain-containing protein [Planctomycetes bacterium]|nr:PDZ domain-containing protein [Planctomycetota bacterium]